jgi:hypothetical protein
MPPPLPLLLLRLLPPLLILATRSAAAGLPAAVPFNATLPAGVLIADWTDAPSGYRVTLRQASAADARVAVVVARPGPPPADGPAATLVWRARLVGPQVVMPPFRPVAAGAEAADRWVAAATLACPGAYWLDLRSDLDAQRDIQDRAAPRVVGPPRGFTVARGDPAACPAHAAYRPPPLPCTALAALADDPRTGPPGSWFIDPRAGMTGYPGDDADAPLSAAATAACLWQTPGCRVAPFSAALARLRFAPATCRLPTPPQLAAAYHRLAAAGAAGAPAAARPSWCWVGDSQMRHLFNAMVRWLEPDNVACRAATLVKEPCVPRHVALHYHRALLPRGLAVAARAASHKCGLVFVNAGQWPLSIYSGLTAAGAPRPYTEAEYVAELQPALAALAQDLGAARVVWVDTGAFPPSGLARSAQPDWRNLQALRLFNAAARHAATTLGLATLGASELGQVLSDLSFDQLHYLAPVGREAARVVLHGALLLAHGDAYRQLLAGMLAELAV